MYYWHGWWCAAGGEADDDENGEDSDVGMKTKKKIKSRYGGVTLEPNAENLNLKELEYQIATDPLFQKTSASFDEGGAKGMLLNHLCVQNGCQIVFDSSDASEDKERVGQEFLEGVEASNDDEEDALDLGDAMAGEMRDALRSIGSAELTPGFTDFRLSRQDGTAVADTSASFSIPPTAENDEYEYDEDEGGYDDADDDGGDFGDDDVGGDGFGGEGGAGFSRGEGIGNSVPGAMFGDR